jgi:hypothetical protein
MIAGPSTNATIILDWAIDRIMLEGFSSINRFTI